LDVWNDSDPFLLSAKKNIIDTGKELHYNVENNIAGELV
jgi:hypothetical protein